MIYAMKNMGLSYGRAVGLIAKVPIDIFNTAAGRQRVNTPLTAENEGQISRVSAHWVLDMLYGDI